MSTSLDVLFRPFAVKGLRLENRIVMAPMNRGRAEGGVPDASMAAYYRRRAENDVGFILSEACTIDRPSAANRPNVPAFHGAKAMASWQAIIDEVHAVGGRMAPQLWHVGGAPDSRTTWRPHTPAESPSGLYGENLSYGVAMHEQAIADTITAFADAAARARNMGFDAVEIHGAHGYLIDQFFWDATNRRDDSFGGRTIGERTLFATELVRAVRRSVGEAFPIIFRISQWKPVDYSVRVVSSPRELEAWLCPLVDAGIDVIDCSQRRFWQAEFPAVDGPGGLSLAGWAKKVSGLPTIGVGSVGLSSDAVGSYAGERSLPDDLDKLVERLARGEFDLIAVGRALLADPQWVVKIRAGSHHELLAFDREQLDTLF